MRDRFDILDRREVGGDKRLVGLQRVVMMQEERADPAGSRRWPAGNVSAGALGAAASAAGPGNSVQ